MRTRPSILICHSALVACIILLPGCFLLPSGEKGIPEGLADAHKAEGDVLQQFGERSDAFLEALAAEPPDGAEEWTDALDRWRALRVDLDAAMRLHDAIALWLGLPKAIKEVTDAGG